MFEPVILPDGSSFESWECPLRFKKTFHVAQNHPGAGDDNPGTEELPWKTIGKAAQVLEPGQRVVIHGGEYREWVKPARGGEGPETMISYEAAEGEEVVIKGADLWKPRWERARSYLPEGVVTWQAPLSSSMFEGANVFCLPNFPDQGHPDWRIFPTFELRRGQLFLNGQPVTQIGHPDGLRENENRFWMEDNGMTIHLRLANDADPNDAEFEVTTREQVFAPIERYLNYIRVKGLTMFHAANAVPIPPPQRGLLSATAGHHWIIEDCEIGYANTLGMDLGEQWWSYGKGDLQGYHIVRGNTIHHCGVSAMSACASHNTVNARMLVEDNLVTDCCWMPITEHYESAGIKIHRTQDSVFRRNVILRTANCASLWLDWEICNTRVTQNLFAEAANPRFGHVFLEINHGPNLVDNNILINSGGNGFYEHDAERIHLYQNLIANGDEAGVMIRWGDPARVNPPLESEHRVFANIITGFPRYIQFPNRTNHADMNVFGARSDLFRNAFKADAASGKEGTVMDLAAWRQIGEDRHSEVVQLNVFFDARDLTLRITAIGWGEWPSFDRLPEIPPQVAGTLDVLGQEIPRVAAPDTLLTHDFFGQKRPAGKIQVGPFLDSPMDGTSFSVDPRRRSRKSVGRNRPRQA
ncbi:MAG: right-handed parallel beta-helix repeat-containing protein [Candidatus Latescibacterota bacterium]